MARWRRCRRRRLARGAMHGSLAVRTRAGPRSNARAPGGAWPWPKRRAIVGMAAKRVFRVSTMADPANCRSWLPGANRRCTPSHCFRVHPQRSVRWRRRGASARRGRAGHCRSDWESRDHDAAARRERVECDRLHRIEDGAAEEPQQVLRHQPGRLRQRRRDHADDGSQVHGCHCHGVAGATSSHVWSSVRQRAMGHRRHHRSRRAPRHQQGRSLRAMQPELPVAVSVLVAQSCRGIRTWQQTLSAKKR
ncbi:hypothetical protein FHR56_001467 [Xanthomonas sacchari]|nr:hypothetical protein [Xanthomonas sp. F10]